MFLIQSAQARGHDPVPSQISNHMAGILSVNYRQTSNVIKQHLRRGVVQSFVGIGYNNVASPGFKHSHRLSRVFVQCAKNISPRDNTS